MSRVIWKYYVGGAIISDHELPAGAEIRHAGIDAEGRLCVWMQVDDEASDFEKHTFGIFNTGEAIPDDWTYIDSVHVSKLVLHVHHYDQVVPIVVEILEEEE